MQRKVVPMLSRYQIPMSKFEQTSHEVVILRIDFWNASVTRQELLGR